MGFKVCKEHGQEHFCIENAEDFAKCFVAWQKGVKHDPVNLSQVKSFLKFMGPTVNNKLFLAASRQVYAECVKLIEADWLRTDEAKALMAVGEDMKK